MARRAMLGLALCCLLASTHAWSSKFGVGLRAGTQGVGVEGAVRVNKLITLRGGAYGYDHSDDFDEGGIDYAGDLELGGYGLLVDIFPTGGRFRVSGGLFSNDNEISVVATPTTDVEIGGVIYTPAQAGTLTGLIDFDSTAPYAGIGWGRVAEGGRIGFLFDLGALFQGSGEVALASDSMLVDPADLAAEIAEIENDISEYDIWPVVSVGLAIRF